MLTVKSAAEFAGVSPSTVRDWCERRDDPVPKYYGPGIRKNYRIKRKELEQWIERNFERIN